MCSVALSHQVSPLSFILMHCERNKEVAGFGVFMEFFWQ